MILVLIKWALTRIALLVSCFMQQFVRPPCNAENHGMVWPAPIARNACTQVQICTLDVWAYCWEPVTADVHQLVKGRRHRVSCRASQAAAQPPASDTQPVSSQ